jgi:hypothetical protein
MGKFYFFSQNNSGGYFDVADDVAEYVIIEANSYQDANNKAEDIGIYFDGQFDCSCCGNRWHEQWDEDDATDQPCIYGAPISEHSPWMTKEYRIHYIDGRVEKGIIEKKR